jgi:hypothetical protein
LWQYFDKPFNKQQRVSIPDFLYRGEDFSQKKDGREVLSRGLLMTNLCYGGNGKEIFIRPLRESINKHVSIGWPKTHFLSFSESEETALNYGSRHRKYEENFFDENWDFALFTLDESKLISIEQKDVGVFEVLFKSSFKEFLPTFKIFLFDVPKHLKSISNSDIDLSEAISNAERDSEWLLLPAQPFQNEFSSKLDTSCLDIRYFSLT